MSEKRIKFTPCGFLLYAELVYDCVKNLGKDVPPRTLESVVADFSQKIKLSPDLQSYARDIGVKCRKQKKLINSLYNKIHGSIISKDDKIIDTIFINEGQDIANYYGYIQKAFNINIPIREFLKDYIEPQFPANTDTLDESFPILPEHLKQLIGTSWYLYYHEYELTSQIGHTVITRLFLEINSLDDVKLYERNENQDFQGTIDLKQSSGNAAVIINLEPVFPIFSAKKLQIRVLLKEKVVEDRILYGTYIDNEVRDSIVSGTVVLENVTGHTINIREANTAVFEKIETISRFFRLRKVKDFAVISVKLSHVSGWEQFIPPEIATYLAHKWMNYSKAVSLSPNSNLSRLRLWLEEKERQKSEQTFRTKFNAIISYDCFLVTPIGDIQSLKELEYYRDINRYLFEEESPVLNNGALPVETYKAAKVLQEIKVFKIFYTPRELLVKSPDFSGGGDSQSIVFNDMAAMKKCRFVIYIIPKPEDILTQHTAALIKIGWAMEQGKTILIFPLAPGLLPKLFLSPIHNVKVSPPVSIEEIPDYIRNHYEYLLRP